MKREEVEAIARELGAFLIYLDKGAIEAQHMDLVMFSNAIEMYVRRLVVRDVAALRAGDVLTTRVATGTVTSTVVDVDSAGTPSE